jgi:hypothetical protein
VFKGAVYWKQQMQTQVGSVSPQLSFDESIPSMSVVQLSPHVDSSEEQTAVRFSVFLLHVLCSPQVSSSSIIAIALSTGIL